MVRDGDFRASGSGNFIFDKKQIDERCVKIVFESIAYDFVFNQENRPLIVEIGYGFAEKVYDACEGFWTEDMQWHEGSHFDFCSWMVENVINSIQ